MIPSDTDQAIEQFLDGKPRSETWRSLKEALLGRLTAMEAELEIAPESSRRTIERKIRELREQVAALAQEEAVTLFVEESVRATVARPHPLERDSDAFDELDGED